MDVDLNDPQFSIVDANVRDKSNQLLQTLNENFDNTKLKYQSTITPTIATHIGPGTLGLFFKTNNPLKVYDED